jgi:Na+-translocating ferredoxin:NAD+ oxidoreductase RnfC subunit
MENYPVINKKSVKQNRELKRVQKRNKKAYGKIRCKLPKASIPKLVSRNEGVKYINLTENNRLEAGTTHIQSADELIVLLKKAGLKGQSGNGFPTADKLQAFNESKVENRSILINSVACDPGLIHDEWLLDHQMDSINKGIEVLQEIFQVRDVVLAVKKREANLQGNYQVKYVPDRYPMGAERILIQQVFGKNIEDNAHPAERGILVLNVQTVWAIGQIVLGTYEPGGQYITVLNMRNGDGVVAKVQRGMSISDIAMKALGCAEINGLFAGSGIMMARPIGKEASVDDKTFFIAVGENVIYDDVVKCKKCGRCTRNCPAGLQVMKMVNKLQRDIHADLSEYSPERCLKCGTCTYFCFAGKNVMKIVSKEII